MKPLLLALLLACSALPAQAVIITFNVIPQLGFFRYLVRVENNEAEDLALVSLDNAPTGDALIAPSLTSPPGYFASYDAGLGIIDFTAGTSFPIGSVVGNFEFDSAAAPSTNFTTFQALGVNGTSYSGATTVPDNGSTLLLALPSFLGLFLLKNRFQTLTNTIRQ